MYKAAHVGLVVHDVDVSSIFYRLVLGGEPAGSYEDDRLKVRMFTVGTQTIELLQYLQNGPEERAVGVVDHIAFFVDDINIAVKRLRSLEVNLLFDSPRTVMDGKQIIFFAGPDGERLEFIQEAAK